jgi:uncharacterized membrane protein YozB (DUF420 family)
LTHVFSSGVMILLGIGLLNRRRARRHMACMLTAFAVDLGLVVYIELTRHAVAEVAGSGRPLLWFHVVVSVGVLAAYLAQIRLGRLILEGQSTRRRTHRRVAWAFVVLRTTNYVTSFLV